MRKVFALLVPFSLTRLSAAQFQGFPICVQPLFNNAFPAACLSEYLATQNTCLCQDAYATGSNLVTTVFQTCGCAVLDETVQLIVAYCAQVEIDLGPAYSVFVQDDTTCGPSTVSVGSTTGQGTSTTTGGSSTTGVTVAVSTPIGGNTFTATGSSAPIPTGVNTVTVTGGSTPTPTGGKTVTVTAGSTSTAAAGTETSGSSKGLVGQIFKVVVWITGGILALW